MEERIVAGVFILLFFLAGCTPKFQTFSETDDLRKESVDWTWLDPKSREHEEKWNALRTKMRGEIAKNPNAPLLLFGDSITQGWRRHEDLLEACMGHTSEPDSPQIINAGIWSDGLQHMRWRLKSGDFDLLNPRLVVFLGGTNNGGQTSLQIAGGIQTLVEEIAQEFPQAHILLLGIFPMDQYPSHRRLKRSAANSILAHTRWNKKRVSYVDLTEAFLGGAPELGKDIFPDYLHLSRLGYGIWASQMCPWVQSYLRTTDAT